MVLISSLMFVPLTEEIGTISLKSYKSFNLVISFKRISLSFNLSTFVKTKITSRCSCFSFSKINSSPRPKPSLISTKN